MSRKVLTVMIIPHDDGSVRHLRISYTVLKLFAVVAILATLGGVVSFVAYGRLAVTAAGAQRLEAENERLRVVRGKVEDLARNLEASERAYRQIREMAGIRTAPSGGATPADSVTLSPSSAANLRALTDEERALLARSRNTAPRLWPLTKKGFVTEDFSPRGHEGMDVAVETNTPVLAAGDGVVLAAGTDAVYGKFLAIAHDPSTVTLYGHNALVFARDGELVRQGDIVAQSGNSGRSTAPHLHFEIRKNGVPVDPRAYLR